ncbi:LLM class flavin-dependent oxidoreductase [Nonomuraea sp. NPDC003804]|uniref:LLM class flavin-dependent oxidoreductase n=1 Tax=Nonomuraea sp. NPDC003804 TaxID=3154547 RepID=UPI0033BAB64E
MVDLVIVDAQYLGHGPHLREALGPAMARVAGEPADVAITWLVPAAHLRDLIVPALREGAEAAGRPIPRLVSLVPVASTQTDATCPIW